MAHSFKARPVAQTGVWSTDHRRFYAYAEHGLEEVVELANEGSMDREPRITAALASAIPGAIAGACAAAAGQFWGGWFRVPIGDGLNPLAIRRSLQEARRAGFLPWF